MREGRGGREGRERVEGGVEEEGSGEGVLVDDVGEGIVYWNAIEGESIAREGRKGTPKARKEVAVRKGRGGSERVNFCEEGGGERRLKVIINKEDYDGDGKGENEEKEAANNDFYGELHGRRVVISD